MSDRQHVIDPIMQLTNLQKLSLVRTFAGGRMYPSIPFLLYRCILCPGSLPSSFSSLSKLTSLVLMDNAMIGTCCASWVKTTRLYQQQCPPPSGRLPLYLSTFTDLSLLHLQQNFLSGSVPEGYTSLQSLSVFHVYDNSLSGKDSIAPSSFPRRDAPYSYRPVPCSLIEASKPGRAISWC